MRRITFSVLGILGLLVGVVLVLPFFFNVNDYKPQIITKAKETLDRDVTIDGNISLHLLPLPQLSVERVGVANLEGGSPQDLIRIKNLSLSVELLPLLKKQVKIKTITVDQPEIFLEKLPDGRVNWMFNPSKPSASSPLSTPSASSPHFDIAFDKILIQKGRIIYHEKNKNVEIQEINLSTKLEALEGPYTVTGTLNAFGQLINVDTKLGALGESQDIALKVQVGGATSFLEGKASFSPLIFKGNLKASADPKKFTNPDSKNKLLPFISELFRIDAAVVADTNAVFLNQAKFELGSARIRGDLKVAFKEGLYVEGNFKDLPGSGQCAFVIAPSSQGLKGSLNATIIKTQELLNWLGIETTTIPSEMLRNLSLSTLYILDNALRLENLNLTVQDAKLHGDISWQSQKAGPLIKVDLESPKIENVLKLFGVKDPKSLGIGKLKSSIQWTKTSFHLAHLKGQLGKNINFAGDVAIDHASVKPKIKALLALNSINVDILLASRQLDPSLYSEGKIFLIDARPASSGSQWSHTPIDFSFLNKFDGQFEISASQLRQKEIVVANPKLIATLQNGRLDIASLTGTIYEGAFMGSGHLTADSILRLHMALKEANMKYLSAHGANVKIVAGKLSITTDFSTRGKSLYAMVQNLAGPVSITAKDGLINGFDLQTLSRQLGNLQDPRSLLGLLNTSMGKGQTPFSSFNGDMVFKNGVGTIQSMNLIAQGGHGQATGSIDLPHYRLDVHAEFRLTDHPKIPPFRMELSGPIDNPARKLDTSILQKYMIENVFKGFVEKLGKGKFNPKDMLGSILGGDKATSANSNEGQPQQQPNKSGPMDKPEQIVKNIFKGIF